jgi:hypothetical protein
MPVKICRPEMHFNMQPYAMHNNVKEKDKNAVVINIYNGIEFSTLLILFR